MPNSNVATLLLIFIAITAVAVLLQACVLLGIYLTVRKAVQRGQDQADDVRARLIPVLDSSKELMESGKEVVKIAKDLLNGANSLIADLEPRLESAATELANMVRDVHQQANRLQGSVDEVAFKALRQVDRVDHMATSTLNGLERFGNFVNETLNVPVRQLSGVIAAAKAVVGTLRAQAPPRPRRAPQAAPVADDKDLFV
jgi:methyl-accepting chemotaxis protein